MKSHVDCRLEKLDRALTLAITLCHMRLDLFFNHLANIIDQFFLLIRVNQRHILNLLFEVL